MAKHNKDTSDYMCCDSVIDNKCLDAYFPATTDAAAAICRKRLFGESSYLLLVQDLFGPGQTDVATKLNGCAVVWAALRRSS